MQARHVAAHPQWSVLDANYLRREQQVMPVITDGSQRSHIRCS